MKRLKQFLLVVCFIINGIPFTIAQTKNWGYTCFSDANVFIPVETAPLINKEEFLKKEQMYIETKFNQWIDKSYANKGLSASDYKKLKDLKISLSDVNNSLGRAKQDSIFIDKGLILAMTDFSFSEALLQTQTIDTVLYNWWHDYFINAIIKQDPVTYCTGVTFYNNNFSKLLQSDTTIRDIYFQTYNSWLAFVLLHEASHILLNHIQKWSKSFPSYTDTNLEKWTTKAFKLSQSQEFEADNLFLELYTKISNYDPVTLLANCADWFIIREGFYLNSGLNVYKTHPATIDRFSNLLTNYCTYTSISRDTYNGIIKMFKTYYSSLLTNITNESLREVPKLKGDRPGKVDAHLERFMVRDSHLSILFSKFNEKNSN